MTIGTISALTATALAFALGATTAAADNIEPVSLLSEEDPFVISERNCIEKGWMETSCVTTNEQTGEFPIGAFIEELNSTIERFRAKNGWGEEVTPGTIVPIGATFGIG